MPKLPEIKIGKVRTAKGKPRKEMSREQRNTKLEQEYGIPKPWSLIHLEFDFIRDYYNVLTYPNIRQKMRALFRANKIFLDRLSPSNNSNLRSYQSRSFAVKVADPQRYSYWNEGIMQFRVAKKSGLGQGTELGTIRFFVLPERTIVIGGVQGIRETAEYRKQLLDETKQTWAEFLMSSVISEARKQGIRKLKLVKPQSHVEYSHCEEIIKSGTNSKEKRKAKRIQKTMSRLYYGLARKFGFRNIEGKYFELKL